MLPRRPEGAALLLLAALPPLDRADCKADRVDAGFLHPSPACARPAREGATGSARGCAGLRCFSPCLRFRHLH